ncbi:phosphoadenylyl-sulfate reductase [Bacillus haynesii]|uniref:phosphoadenylyl-sulfate reductase n=1 Tax=Bacillus haynesii TaxID=1925021 RepID=UPI002280C66B|nr:phosphoadenylyl-sulfate reductase [Bacillus haynesii]MCY7966231.1 phosphoadenylyl-sulfate reductase [Bacillus haynesii]MCY9212137.1 phosphoadenylyl-sulfate reductase [Bacillus haynesii]MEC1577048.1 phosphoadenylyl-sulfate reductase [Bacillus haynesii]
MFTYSTWEEPNISFQEDDSYKGALSVLKWAYGHYGDQLVYACSFGIEGIVLIDLIYKVKKDAVIVFLDTGLHFKETYETIDAVKERYPGLQIIMKKPELTVEEQAKEYGDELWKTAPNSCCEMRKVIPLRETLSGYPAWLSGLRREQSPGRSKTNFLNKDEKFKSIKVCPLIHWTWKDIWRYVTKHDLPYNPLHDQGYPSIGCAPCTSPAFTMDDLRSGRWNGSAKIECGLHE